MTEHNAPQMGATPGQNPDQTSGPGPVRGPAAPFGYGNAQTPHEAPRVQGASWAQGTPGQPGQSGPQSGHFGPAPAATPHQRPFPASPQPAPRKQRKARTWPAVVGTAAVTAVLVGGGTAAGTVALLQRDAVVPAGSSTDVGATNKNISVTAVGDSNWESIASEVAPSVVAIEVRTNKGGGEGSGVIIDTEGHVLTNDHVVTGAVNDTVQVTLSDGRLYEAKIVGLDPSTDLAVIKLIDAPDGLTPAKFADSDDVIVGNAVMAVGNPLGLANTVTTGIVSAVARPVSTASEQTAQGVVVTNAIQIDAAVNPGNSGGPLFNVDGEVIGITSSIASLSGGGSVAGSIGLGFAIPSNLASAVGEQLMADGFAEHAFLGVGLSDATATADGVTRRGAKVESVTQGSPAADAGIKAGDVIIAFDGQKTAGYESLTAFVRERISGETATVTLVRSGNAQDINVTLAARESNAPGSGKPDESEQPRPGNSDPAVPPEDLFDWFSEQGN